MPAERLPQPLKALYVQDDADLCEIVSWILAGYGVDLTTCATAEDALDRFQPGLFDAVLTDIGLRTCAESARRVHLQSFNRPPPSALPAQRQCAAQAIYR